MKHFLALFFFSMAAFACAHQADTLSLWMARSEIQRRAPLRWNYADALKLEALHDVYERYGGEDIRTYVSDFIDDVIASDGHIRGYSYEAFNLDNVRPGMLLLRERVGGELSSQGIGSREQGAGRTFGYGQNVEQALETLFLQLEHQPRTADGPWWHKTIYAHQVWLDGIYMGLPFYVRAAPLLRGDSLASKYWDDAASQILATDRRTFDPVTGLWKHAWDETHSVFWADPSTGLSRHSWTRAMGWYTMALLEVLDALPENYARRGELVALFQKVCKAIVRCRDSKAGVWYDVLDVTDPRNYLESSASSMFTFALLKGVRKGYLGNRYLRIGRKAYKCLLRQFLCHNADGTISLTHCCSVSGLGPGPNEYVSTPNYRRDGSFGYYISEPVVVDDPKAIAPFIWASLEIEASVARR